jgi:hypothetical protein
MMQPAAAVRILIKRAKGAVIIAAVYFDYYKNSLTVHRKSETA